MSDLQGESRNAPVSVLMPVYKGDGLRELQLAIASVENQTELPDEFVVVVDGPIPSDLSAFLDTWPSVSRISNVRVIRTPKNVGIARALNHGLKECTRTLVMRMDADDLCMPGRVEATKNEFHRTSAQFLYSGAVEFLDESLQLTFCKEPPSEDEITKSLRIRNSLCHPAVTMRRSVLELIGGYRDCAPFEDHDLFLRLAHSNISFHKMASPQIFFRTSRAQRKRRSGIRYVKQAAAIRSLWRKERLISRADEYRGIGGICGFSLMPDLVRRIAYSFLRSPLGNTEREHFERELRRLSSLERTLVSTGSSN